MTPMSLVNIVLFLSIFSSASQSFFCRADDALECTTTSGPAGIYRCVLLNEVFPYYNDYQWATCMTEVYLQEITGGKDECVDPTATYCWFQCMLETYNSMGPDVSGVCLCSANDSYTTFRPEDSSLPSDCYSPDGTDCHWYADCLEAKYPCSGTGAGYAIEYATKFCNLFLQNLNQYSSIGQRWISAVRKCLQVKLVPLLRQRAPPSCAEIRLTALASHSPCYLNPYQGAPSICDLPLSDIVPMFFTIQSAFTDPATAGESLCGALDVARGCYSQWQSSRPCLRAFTANFRLLYGAVLPTAATWAIKAARFVQKIGQKLNWDSTGLRYFGCAVDWVDAGDTGAVSILLAVRDNYNCLSSLLSGRKKRSTFDLDAVAADFENAVSDGSLLLELDDGETLYVTGMAQCDPPACANGITMSVTAPLGPPPRPPTTASTVPHTTPRHNTASTVPHTTPTTAVSIP